MNADELPMGGCSRVGAHMAHLAAGDPTCENERGAVAPECVRSASCEPGDHSYSWPCVLAADPGGQDARRVLMTVPHDGHRSTETCPACPHTPNHP